MRFLGLLGGNGLDVRAPFLVTVVPDGAGTAGQLSRDVARKHKTWPSSSVTRGLRTLSALHSKNLVVAQKLIKIHRLTVKLLLARHKKEPRAFKARGFAKSLPQLGLRDWVRGTPSRPLPRVASALGF